MLLTKGISLKSCVTYVNIKWTNTNKINKSIPITNFIQPLLSLHPQLRKVQISICMFTSFILPALISSLISSHLGWDPSSAEWTRAYAGILDMSTWSEKGGGLVGVLSSARDSSCWPPPTVILMSSPRSFTFRRKEATDVSLFVK